MCNLFSCRVRVHSQIAEVMMSKKSADLSYSKTTRKLVLPQITEQVLLGSNKRQYHKKILKQLMAMDMEVLEMESR